MKISDVSIIIPSVSFDYLTKKCVLTCKKFFPEAEILVLVDKYDYKTKNDIDELIICGPINISSKRNKAAYKASGKLLAFIDSDAFPDKSWLFTAVDQFEKNSDLVALAGPNIMPLDTIGYERLVGLVEKSPLVTINGQYIKAKKKPRYVNVMPSCNLIVKKKFYLQIGGMNENLFGGEDFEFCKRMSTAGKKILYHPEAFVYHKCRSLMPFIKKRLSYGGFAYDNISYNMNFQMIISMIPTINFIIIISSPTILFFPETTQLYLIYLMSFF